MAKLVENEIKKLSPGKILFNPPRKMKVGLKERVEVRIAKTIEEDLTAGLRGRGVVEIEGIQVATFMKVRLKGDNFDIKTLSHEEQIITEKGFTHWAWDVTPLKSGILDLLLTVTVRIKIPNYADEKKDIDIFKRQIKVKVNPPYAIRKFIENYWKWIITAVLIPMGCWILKKWRDTKKKNG